MQHAESIAFVPTMGNLHAGHLALVDEAKRQASHVVVSIFVNPLQFGPNEDFANYPRTFDTDCAKLEQLGVDWVFAPLVQEMYPDFDGQDLHQTMIIQPPPLADALCGEFRPGHFAGVATVVMKLFQIVQPDVALFGKKDYQQLAVIRSLVRQFNMPIQIVALDTVRESDGLAMSSRNAYLTAEERQEAVRMYRVMEGVIHKVTLGLRDYDQLEKEAEAQLIKHGWVVDYIAVRTCMTLSKPTSEDTQLVVLGAARLGKTRLIDNIEFCANSLK